VASHIWPGHDSLCSSYPLRLGRCALWKMDSKRDEFTGWRSSYSVFLEKHLLGVGEKVVLIVELPEPVFERYDYNVHVLHACLL
jgi:hypothetical protein